MWFYKEYSPLFFSLLKFKVPLTYKDKAYLYFMMETGEQSRKSLSERFCVTLSLLTTICVTWAKVCRVRYKAFGMYLTWEEYQLKVTPEWHSKYNGRWCHLWDTTNINFAAKPTDAWMQDITFSLYYKKCCGKGGVACIPGGWNMAAPLHSGSISDTKYMEDSGILLEQQKLADSEDGNAPHSITNITDRGMKCEVTAWRYGKQTFLTPAFKLSGQVSFLPSQALRITTIARDRAQNERMVKRPKLFKFLTAGIPLNMSMLLLNAMWMNINFRTNFIYRSLKISNAHGRELSE